MKRAAVLGAGAWGTALAKLLSDRGQSVALWARNSTLAAEIHGQRENVRYLPGAQLGPEVDVTSQLSSALDGADLVVIAVPSDGLREVIRAAKSALLASCSIVSATKGIENDSLMLMREVILDELGDGALDRLFVLSGPTFAREVASGLPSCVVVAGTSLARATAVQQRCATDRLRVYTSDDPVGVELGGALKNVIAIAAGAGDGLGYGHNARAAIVTRGLAEIVRLSVAKGGNPLTLAGLAGLGDLVLTCTGELSRNRTVGWEMGQGQRLDEVLPRLGHVAEGVKTAKSAYDLSRKLGVDMPITAEVYRVLYEGKSAKQAVSDLMARELRPEF
jgi:glycerol-3-phosphate dehydrogenase (NAD(P)+)